MINETYKEMLGKKSVIRQLSEFATARGKEIGYENVYDYSLGNPSVPVPEEFTKAMIERNLQMEDGKILGREDFANKYAEEGTYDIIVTGVIENITGFTTNGIVIWNKLQ